MRELADVDWELYTSSADVLLLQPTVRPPHVRPRLLRQEGAGALPHLLV
jgi:hypothetical protein